MSKDISLFTHYLFKDNNMTVNIRVLQNIMKIVLIFTSLLSLASCNDTKSPVIEEKSSSSKSAIKHEKLNAAWSEMIDENQKRMALIPELLTMVRIPYDREQKAFEQLREARAEVGGIQASEAMLNSPQELNDYQEAQEKLGIAIAQLIEVSNQYPKLISDATFQDFLVQLELQEKKIALARDRYKQQGVNYESVLLHYKRRQDLASILPKIVKNYTFNDDNVFTQITVSESTIENINISSITPDDQPAVERYLEAQAKMDTAIFNLMIVQEHYTELKSNTEFLRLKSVLEKINNRRIIAHNIYKKELEKSRLK